MKKRYPEPQIFRITLSRLVWGNSSLRGLRGWSGNFSGPRTSRQSRWHLFCVASGGLSGSACRVTAALALPPYTEVPERPWETPVGNPRPRRAKKDLSPLVRPRGAQRAPWDSWANIAPAQNAIINVIVKRLNWVSFSYFFSCASTQIAASGVYRGLRCPFPFWYA